VKLHRIQAVILRQGYEARRNLDRVTDILFWPVLDVFLWGFFTVYLAHGSNLKPGLITFLLGAAILWGVFRAFQRDMTIGFLSDLWSRNLANLFSTPLTISEYMTALIAVNLGKTILGMTTAALIAWIFYAYNIFRILPALLPFLLNLVAFAFVVGLAITGLVLRYTTRVQGLTWSFTGFLMPISCVFYPLSALPKYLQPFAWALPTTHSFEGMRQVIAGGAIPMAQFEWGLALNVVYFIGAVAFFHWMFERARAHGLLIKQE
jgi:ABC-2 type transport system permease protein